jgi:uncharacterized protein YegL
MKIVHFLLDESGSMNEMKQEAIDGYNNLLDKLEAEGADIQITLTKFDTTKLEEVHPPIAVGSAIRLNNENYRPGAGTPLFDAVVHAIRTTEGQVREIELQIGMRPDVLIAVLTDGHENASQDNDLEKVNQELKEHETAWGWSFAYIGAAPDAWDPEAFVGTMAAVSSSLSSQGKRGLAESLSATADATTRWAAGAQYAYTAEEKKAVEDASDQQDN